MPWTSLEAKLPPLALAWLSQNPPVGSEEIDAAIARLDELIAEHVAGSPQYLRDVVFLASRYRHVFDDGSFVSGFVAPLLTDFTPDVGRASFVSELASTIAALGGNEEFVALYRYTCAVKVIKDKMSVVQQEASPDDTASVNLLEIIVRNFCPDCKFKKTNDLFIWTVIILRCPAWVCAGLHMGQSPFHLCARVHTDSTNGVVQPLVKSGVEHQLDRLETTELFCVVACLVLELLGEKGSTLFLANTHIAAADPDVPTLAVVNESISVDGKTTMFGYVHHHVFYTSDSVFLSLVKWLAVYKPSSHLYQLVAAKTAILDNPYSKFVR